MRSNPAALAWMLVLGHEARVSGDDEREVGAMITTQYMTPFTPEEMTLLIEQGKAKDARIAELEQQLAAAQERFANMWRIATDAAFANQDARCCFCNTQRGRLHEADCALNAWQQEGSDE